MSGYILTTDHMTAYGHYLRQEERSAATLEKYLRDINSFACWLGDSPVSRETVTG